MFSAWSHLYIILISCIASLIIAIQPLADKQTNKQIMWLLLWYRVGWAAQTNRAFESSTESQYYSCVCILSWDETKYLQTPNTGHFSNISYLNDVSDLITALWHHRSLNLLTPLWGNWLSWQQRFVAAPVKLNSSLFITQRKSLDCACEECIRWVKSNAHCCGQVRVQLTKNHQHPQLGLSQLLHDCQIWIIWQPL